MVILGSTDLEQKAWFPGNWDASNEIVECFAITQIWSQLSRVKWSMFYYTLDTYIFKFSFNANQIICDCIYVPENRGEHKGFIVFTEKEHSLNLVLSYILLILYTVDLGFFSLWQNNTGSAPYVMTSLVVGGRVLTKTK